MIGLIISVNGRTVDQVSVGSFGAVQAHVFCIERQTWLRRKKFELSVDTNGVQLDPGHGRRHRLNPPVKLRVGDVVTIKAIETSDVSPGKWTKWEPHDFEEDEKNRVRSQCFALGWEIDEGSSD